MGSFLTYVTCRRDKGTRREWTYSGCNLVTIVRWQMGPGDLARLGSGSGRHVSSCNTCTDRYVLEFSESHVMRSDLVTLIECRWTIKSPESRRMRILYIYNISSTFFLHECVWWPTSNNRQPNPYWSCLWQRNSPCQH